MEVGITGCESARVYRPAPLRKLSLIALLIAIYAVVLPLCYSTAGQPRSAAFLHSFSKYGEKWEAWQPEDDTNPDAELSIHGVRARQDALLRIESPESAQYFQFSTRCVDDRLAAISYREFRQFVYETFRIDGEPALPPFYLPSALACLSLFGALTLHALFHLMCHWSAAFKATAYNAPTSFVDESCCVVVRPPSNRGESVLVPIKKHNEQLQIVFQRQTYFFQEDSELHPNGAFVLVPCPVDKPLSSYACALGLRTTKGRGNSPSQVEQLLALWGSNVLDVPIPSFFTMLRAQMLSPLVMFQVFCSALWLLDEYWSITLWTLFMMLIFEGSTVFQRSRTRAMLSGMAPQPKPVYVLRDNAWVLLTSKDLLPGDIISVTQSSAPATQPAPAAGTPSPSPTPAAATNATVPCDCLLLRGSAVVNEASLTGESVPQMKEALDRAASVSTDNLDMNGVHRTSVLFSGTTLIVIDAHDSDAANYALPPTVPAAPDNGAIAFVLRTGFSSSQGSQLQLIEFSQQSVAGDSKETGMALLLLLCFALAAAAYVFTEGMKKREKTTHELLLKCVIIITSVVPKQFPMQMAMAVNMALMSLHKVGVFCTEPFRVPSSGKVSHVFFDKTGTLTTDQLVPAGIISSANSKQTLEPVPQAAAEAILVLAACHSLVEVQNSAAATHATTPAPANASQIAGDPIELSALDAVEWNYQGSTSTARPGAFTALETAMTNVRTKMTELENIPAAQRPTNYAQFMDAFKAKIAELDGKMKAARSKAAASPYRSARIAHRYHFSSALQRMSVIACVNDKDWYCLVKGSPEALKPLFAEAPSWYQSCYEKLARQGLRVLSLAYRKLSAEEIRSVSAATASSSSSNHVTLDRVNMEQQLHFCGFIAFECKVRADSGVVVQSLRDSDHCVCMLTGDGLLTSLHVAKSVGIVTLPPLTLEIDNNNQAHWSKHTEGQPDTHLPFDLKSADLGIPSLSAQYDLITTESTFKAVCKLCDDKLWQYASVFRVFARMSPQGKATVIKAVQQYNDGVVLMAGDGGNDVGALKQADIGMALLSGHSNANTSDDVLSAVNVAPAALTSTAAPQSALTQSGSTVSAEDALNAHDKVLQQRNQEYQAKHAAHMKAFQAQLQQQLAEEMKAKMSEFIARGEYSAMFSAVKQNAIRTKDIIAQEQARFAALHGQTWDKKNGSSDPMASLMDSLETMDTGTLPMVRPGDASIAAPFTSRVPSVRAVVDLIRQGRCTLLSALMQQQIMMLESIISAYTLSALSLHNARSSERQMMASSWLIMTAAVSFSYAAPLDKMAKLRPLRSLFHPAILLSILGQAAIHVACMTLAVQWATEAMGPEQLKEVTEFFRKAKAKEITLECGEDDFMCQFRSMWEAPFMPNLLNTTVFLVETGMTISVFFANYKGRPWMKGMIDNHPLFLSVFACIGGCIVAAWELVPALNELIQLTPFPSDEYRAKVLLLVLSAILGTFLWDRLCTAVFAPKVFKAMFDEARKTSISDMMPVVTTLAKVVGVVVLLGTGNLLLIGGAFWWWRSQSAAAANPAPAATPAQTR